jgi:hypothetical protein
MVQEFRFAVIALAALSFFATALPAMAQEPLVPVRPRVEINPRPLYRRCASRYVVQYRPSGTVLFPEKHCWWQR